VIYGFNGTINGEHFKGTYDYVTPGVGSIGLAYTFHHHKVDIFGDLNETTTSPNHMDVEIGFIHIGGGLAGNGDDVHGTIHLMKEKP
jgi:hypothetical protein